MQALQLYIATLTAVVVDVLSIYISIIMAVRVYKAVLDLHVAIYTASGLLMHAL